MGLLDTNVLVHAADEASAPHRMCHELVEGFRRGPDPWYLTWPILYEFLRVTTHPRVFDSPWDAASAWQFVEALLGSSSLSVLAPTARHPALLAAVVGETPVVWGNLFHDLHTAVLMREHGIRRVYTRDTDFHRFPWVEVVDPLRPA